MNRTNPNTAMRDLLTPGPRNSREVLAAMAEQGFTPKQVRRVREQLGVDVERTGSGATMQSTWRLRAPTNPNSGAATSANLNTTEPQSPTAHSCPSPGGEAAEPEEVRRTVRTESSRQVRARAGDGADGLPRFRRGTAGASDQQSEESSLSGDEQRRHGSRVAAFVARGMPVATATEVADALARADRDWQPAIGSCAQCQNLSRGLCPVTPRPPVEIHECWFRRQDTP